MLNSLVIKNFRMLEDFTVSKLGRVNLIVGKNNSGKSTVLEALRIYGGKNGSFIEEIIKNRDGVANDLLFDDRGKNKEFSIGGKLYGSFEEHFSKFSLSIDNMFTTHGYLSFTSAFIPTAFISMFELKREWEDIELTDDEEIVKQALQIIVPDFQRLGFFLNQQEQKWWVKVKLANLPKPVPLKSLGDGMLRVLQIAIKLVSAQGGFLLIDEFENGLHYSTQEKIWALLFEMAEKLDIQVFATTHSWDCIESFTKVAIENETTEGVLFRMGRSAKASNKGQVIATVYDKERLYNITQADIEVR